jgi:hypothetical protein
MAHAGPLPKPNKLGATPNALWVDVPDVPFDAGRQRELPALAKRAKWDPWVLRWWDVVRTMPHCALWTESDWLFAEVTARQWHVYLKQVEQGVEKTTAATELRRREDQMGTTLEARRKNRIRYIDPPDQEPGDGGAKPGAPGGTVTSITARKKRLLDTSNG